MGHVKKLPISVLITEECNLCCEYCITDSPRFQKKPQTIDLDFVRQGISYHFAKVTDRHLRLYSVGEPTTRFDLVKKIVNFARSISASKVNVELQTNGYFATETARWICQNIEQAWISLDGPPEINDKYRKNTDGLGSSGTVSENIKFLAGEIEVGVRATCTDINVASQKELLDYCRELGVSKVASKPVLSPVGEGREKWSVDLMEYAENFLEAWEYARDLGMYYTCVLIFNFDHPTRYACRACFPTPHLTPDGYVSACDRAFLGDTPLKDLIYGKWLPDERRIEYDQDKINEIRQRTPEHISQCLDCRAREYCAGNCMGTGYQETGDLLGVSERYCEAILYLFEKMRPHEKPFASCCDHP